MARGDATRVWFPDMLKELEVEWLKGMNWPKLIIFCQQMTIRRMEIMFQKGIKGPKIKCPDCGKVDRQNKIELSVRSALFALHKNNIILDEELKKLDKDWKSYAKRNKLNMYGKMINIQPDK